MKALQQLDHPTADEVFHRVRRQLPRISLGTVYRRLDRIVNEGAARVHEVEGVRRYDVHVAPHIHLHDSTRGRLVDVPIPPDVQKSLDHLAHKHGLDSPRIFIELRGHLKEPIL